jgi:hypothetical protein
MRCCIEFVRRARTISRRDEIVIKEYRMLQALWG